MKNYYTTLQVKPTATTKEIKKAYRKMVFELHPDRNDNYNKEHFQHIKKAYETLIDPEKRVKYDSFIKSWKEQKSKIDEAVKKRYEQKTANSTHKTTNTNNTNKKSKKKSKDENILKHKLIFFLTLEEMTHGKVIPVFIKGTQINIKIPPKSYKGRTITYLAEAHGQSVHIHVHVDFKKGIEKIYKQSGDVYIEKSVDSNTAALGGKEKMMTPTGEEVDVNLRGGLRNGQVIRLKGAGAYNASGKRGDLFITISVSKVIFSLKAIFGN